MLISRVFVTSHDAHAAVNELKQAGFAEAAIWVAPAANGQRGTLVGVDSPFGTGAAVTRIFARERAGDIAKPEISEATLTPQPAGSDATPLSTSMGWKVLSSDPTPLSTFLGVATLTARQSPTTWLFNAAAPLSAALFLKVLWNRPAPLSSVTGGMTLLDSPALLSTSIKFPTLWRNPAPLSSLLRLKLLFRGR